MTDRTIDKYFVNIRKFQKYGTLPRDMQKELITILEKNNIEYKLDFKCVDVYLGMCKDGVVRDYERINNTETLTAMSYADFIDTLPFLKKDIIKVKKETIKMEKHAYIYKNTATFFETEEEAKQELKNRLAFEEYGYVCLNIQRIECKKSFRTHFMVTKKEVVKKDSTKKTTKKKEV